MYWTVRNFFGDLDDYDLLDRPLPEVFNYVKHIPYVEDNSDEVVARPGFLLNPDEFEALDCKKKAVIMASWLEAHTEQENWRFVGSSEREDEGIHHVFVQVKIDDEWYNVDATYPEYQLYQAKPETTAAEELLG